MDFPKKTSVSISPQYFQEVEPKPDKKKSRKTKVDAVEEPHFLIGFDTEYKAPGYEVNRDVIAAGGAKYRVLSYQFHAKHPDGREWQGICCPENEERMTLGDFVVFALGLGIRDHGITAIPRKIYLVGHFTRADMSAFSDFRALTGSLSNVRNTFISKGVPIKLNIAHADQAIELDVLLRDTYLLSPQSSRSLKTLGDLVGVPKLVLDANPAKHDDMIQNMDRVRRENWEIFKAYAINDAVICVRYMEHVIREYQSTTGLHKIPATLTSIGVDKLLLTWEKKLGLNALEILGKEVVEEKVYNKERGYPENKKVTVDIEEVHRHVAFVTETYHGGRGEQYWFGPGFEGCWTDYDLSSAYPTAMSLIGMPLWDETHVEMDASKYTATTLGFVTVDFEFPSHTRYPTLPIRTANGLIFPLKGRSNCAAPELVAAIALGAKTKITHGVIVPTDTNVRVFGDFIKDCLAEREAAKAANSPLRALFWKEISNSTYGKTAQGLHTKRVFDMSSEDTKDLPPSPITNCFFASYITSFVRAVLGEIINSLEPSVCVFSCTTDGFLTTATNSEIAIAQQGELCQLYGAARLDLTGKNTVLETKHSIRQPLGWRTRGQATLQPGTDPAKASSYNVVLAKGGIYTRREFDDVEKQNAEIVQLFFNRTPDMKIRIEGSTGVRDMVQRGTDFTEKVFDKRLNMEYDWKRRAVDAGESAEYNHVFFKTKPWETVSQFVGVRNAWEKYTAGEMKCLKTREDLENFQKYLEVQTFMTGKHSRYLGKSSFADLRRLRQVLCSAWKQGHAGLNWLNDERSAPAFATLLSKHGIPCEKTDVENARKRPFEPNSCPPTADVEARLRDLKVVYPELDVELLLFRDNESQAITMKEAANSPFIRLVA